jgi:predicted aconitase
LYLSREQEKILSGEEGEARRDAMEILVKFGDSVGADSLVPIKSAHVLAHYSSLHDSGLEFYQKLAEKGGKFSVYTTVDPASIDFERWREFGISEEYAEKQLKLRDAFVKMGGVECWSCAQYQVCNFPAMGDTISWAESNSVVFANSLLGCRTNKVTFGLDVASAIIGLTPKYGMLLDENRKATLNFRVCFKPRNELDYRSIGYYIGKNSKGKIPALTSIPKDITSDELKHLGAAAAASGPVTMIHYIGFTPGSDTLEKATKGDMVETIDITIDDIKQVQEELNQTDERPDLVALGVPHLSINEVAYIAKFIQGRKVKRGINFFIYTSKQVKEMAERYGLKDAIESSGARITHSTDAEISPLSDLGFQVVMTNSAKLAEIVSSEGEVEIRYESLESIMDEVTEK